VEGRGRPDERLGGVRDAATQRRTTLPAPLTLVREAASSSEKKTKRAKIRGRAYASGCSMRTSFLVK